jgi:hypothetical protein
VAHPTEPLPTDPFSVFTAIAEPDVYIGRSETTMWMRVISSWCCYALYAWSLWVVSVSSVPASIDEK